MTKRPRPAPNAKPTFEQDHRKTNPGLHLFYVKTAVTHLRTIDKCQEALGNHSNGNLLDMQVAINTQRWLLVANDAAYADAQEILESLDLSLPKEPTDG